MFFTTQANPVPPAAAGEEDAMPRGNESRGGGQDQNVPLDRVREYDVLGNRRLQPAADEYYHAACHGAFIAGSTIELRKLLAAACVTEGITPYFGQRLEAIVHNMEAIDDGHRFRLAYLRKYWDIQMHHRFGGALRRNNRNRDGSGGRRENFKTTRPGREAVAPRATFVNDATKNSGKGEAKVERAPPSYPAPAYGAFRRVRHTTKTPTYFITDVEAKSPSSELMRASIETLYGTDDWGAKVLDPQTTSLTANIYSN
eukprot:jgi/Tetstr1/433482/TSEL_022754.t1